MSRQHFEQALKSFDDLEDQHTLAQADVRRYRKENETLLSEVAEASSEIQELKARLKHIETVMSARIVAAACDIVEENSRKALEAVRDKVKDKLKDLFHEPAKPMVASEAAAVTRANEATHEVIKLQEYEDHQDEAIDPYAPKTPLNKTRLIQSTAHPPSFLTNRKPSILQPESFGRRIVLLLLGG